MSNALVHVLGWNATVLHGDPMAFDRWRWLRRHLTPGPVRTLDAGCGSGAFTMYAGKIGNHATGIDYNPHNCERARERARILQLKNTEFRQGDLRALDQLADQLEPFDQIICFETIEHIINDRKLIADLAALLKPGGRLLLSAPYKGYKPLLGDKLSDREDGGHVRWGYTHEELRQMLSECGLQVTTAEYVSGFVSQQLGNLLRLMGKVSPTGAWAATFPLRVLQASDRFITKLLNYPYLSVAVVGVKNGSSQRADKSVRSFDGST